MIGKREGGGGGVGFTLGKTFKQVVLTQAEHKG